MTLKDIKPLGRFQHEDGRTVNLNIGRNTERSTDHIYYLSKGKRIHISDREFYDDKKWIKIKS